MTNLVNKIKNKFLSRPTLGWDDLIIFKCFGVIFSIKKKSIQFSLSFNLYFQQKNSTKVVNSPLTDETLFAFLTSKTGQIAFPIFKVIMR